MARSGNVKSSLPIQGLQRQLCHENAQFIIIPSFNEISECISAYSRFIYAREEIFHRRLFKARYSTNRSEPSPRTMGRIWLKTRTEQQMKWWE